MTTPATDRIPLPGAQPPAEPAPPSQKTVNVTIAVLAFSAFVMILNETVLSIAMPPLMRDFAVGETTVQWLTTGFLLTMAVVIPTTGYLLQRYTVRRLFIVALSLFLLGTTLAILAPSFGVMLAARVLQAGGTAIIMPLLMTTTLTLVAPQRRGAVMGLNSIVISVGPAIGPTVSGAIIDLLSWRWVFGLMVPIALVVLLIGLRFMPALGGGGRARLDIPSVFLSLFGFGGLVTAVSTLTDLSRGSFIAPISLVIGIIGVVLFVFRQRRLQADGGRALLDLSAFQVRNFRLAVIVIMVAKGALLGTVVVIPILAQTGLGLSVLATGMLLLPGGIVQGVLAPFVGRLYDRFGPKPLVVPGAILLSGAQWWLSTIQADTPVWTITAMHVTFSIGMALIQTPMMTHALGSLPRHQVGHGSAIFNTLQQLGGAAGTAALVGALAIGASLSGIADGGAQIAGAHLAFVVGGILTLVAVFCAPMLSREDAPADR